MSELAGKEELYAGIASGLETLITQREAEPLDVQIERELSDPNRSFTAFMSGLENEYGLYYKVGEDSRYCRIGSQDDDILEFRKYIYRGLHSSVAETKWAPMVYKPDSGEVAPDALDLFWYAALSHARKQIQDKDNHTGRLQGVFVAAYVASQTMPEGYDGSTRPKKHKHESSQEAVFRKSIGMLHDALNFNKSNDQKRFGALLDAVDGLKDKSETEKNAVFKNAMSHPENSDARRGHSDMHLHLAVSSILERLADPEYTPDMVREENYKFAQLNQLRDMAEPSITEPDIEETHWTILPPGTMEELETTGGRDGGGDSPYFVDPERIKWLAHLATAWSPDAYIAIADLKNNGDTQYLAAILPQNIDGVAVEHAVAENASSHNATYVFRAERGMDDGNAPWLTWRDVLSDTRSGARALGARKILHGNYWDENVHEYLTRPPEDLDKKEYKR